MIEAARDALEAATGVLRGEPASYATLLRETRRLLVLADLPVPCELSEDAVA